MIIVPFVSWFNFGLDREKLAVERSFLLPSAYQINLLSNSVYNHDLLVWMVTFITSYYDGRHSESGWVVTLVTPKIKQKIRANPYHPSDPCAIMG
jgi:hypothetical protein